VQADTLTNSIREFLYFLTDQFLVYYAASRLPSNRRDLGRVLWAFSLGILALSLISMFEVFRGWLLYQLLSTFLGLPIQMGYLIREGTGLLRAMASTEHSTILGYVSALAVLMHLAVADFSPVKADTRKWQKVIAAMLVLTCVAAQSRGAWLALIVAVGCMLINQRGGWKPLLMLVGGGVALVLLSKSTGVGESFVNILPFVGNSDQGNVDYRAQLLDVCWMVAQQNLLLGNQFYMFNPLMRSLVQGQGIIDIVNSYLLVLLENGLVGLTLFISLFAASILGVWRSMRQLEATDHEMAQMGWGLIAVQICVLITIAATSNVTSIVAGYMFTCGLCLSYQRVCASEMQAHTRAQRQSLSQKGRVA
jgi:O-antigen ligase